MPSCRGKYLKGRLCWQKGALDVLASGSRRTTFLSRGAEQVGAGGLGTDDEVHFVEFMVDAGLCHHELIDESLGMLRGVGPAITGEKAPVFRQHRSLTAPSDVNCECVCHTKKLDLS